MTDFAKTVALLSWAELPIRSLDLATVQYWLARGFTPERVATEIFAVDPALLKCAAQDWPARES